VTQPYPDPGRRDEIDGLLSRMLVDDNPDTPRAADGFVLTLLWPCDAYDLPEERELALRDYALTSGSREYHVKLLRGSPWVYEAPPGLPVEQLTPSPDDEDGTTFMAFVEQHWHRRAEDLWWSGEWPSGRSVLDHFKFLEHVLLDGCGRWAILFSPEDHGYLVSDPSTSNDILALWKTTPEEEVERYAADLAGGSILDVRTGEEILRHATAALWT
jgi:hypothetical protein